jgi:hypothetical protein
VDFPVIKQRPINAYIIEAAEKYNERVGERVTSLTDTFSSFLLEEVAPSMLALYNGQQDATDILKETFKSDPQLQAINLVGERTLWNALKVRTVSKIAEALKLTPAETSLTMIQSLDLPHSVMESLIKDIIAQDHRYKEAQDRREGKKK